MKNNIYKKIIDEFNNNKFYQSRFNQMQVNDFLDIPTIDPKDVMDLYYSRNQKDSTVFFTSGTTGDPKSIYYGKGDINYFTEYIKWFCEIEKIQGGEVVLILMDQSFWGVGYITGLGHIKAGNTIVPIDNDLPKEKLVDIIESVKPTVISSLPSVLIEVGDVINNYKFKVVETTGEKLTEDDRLTIEKIYGGEVFDAYGLTEAVIGVECEKHDGYHYNNDKLFLEIIDSDNNSLDEDSCGELIITTINSDSSPIIRYRSGDRCKISSKKCSCGSQYPKIWIEGRIKPTLLLHEGYKIEVSEVKDLVNKVKDNIFVSSNVEKINESKYLLTIILDDIISDDEKRLIKDEFVNYSYELMHMLRNSKLEIIFKSNERN